MGFASDSDDDFLPFSVPVLAMVAAEVEVEQARATQRGSAAGGEVDGSDPMEWFGAHFGGRRQDGLGSARPNRSAARPYIEENLHEAYRRRTGGTIGDRSGGSDT